VRPHRNCRSFRLYARTVRTNFLFVTSGADSGVAEERREERRQHGPAAAHKLRAARRAENSSTCPLPPRRTPAPARCLCRRQSSVSSRRRRAGGPGEEWEHRPRQRPAGGAGRGGAGAEPSQCERAGASEACDLHPPLLASALCATGNKMSAPICANKCPPTCGRRGAVARAHPAASGQFLRTRAVPPRPAG